MNSSGLKDLSDDILQLFLDGELEEQIYLEIKERLVDDDDARNRFEKLKEINDLVAGYNRSVLSEPVPDHLKHITRRRSWIGAQGIAASLLLVGLGILVGWALIGHGSHTQTDMLVQQALTAHSVYTPEVLHSVEVTGDRKEHLSKWLSKRLDTAVKIPDLSAFDYQLLGGRLLPGDDQTPHAMLMYEKPNGFRVSVYIVPSVGEKHTSTLFIHKNGLNAFYWVDSVLSCAVVFNDSASEDIDTLARLSESVYEQVEL
ncbi:MAG: anti-sigma factor [marine bacterium B5-7]|nr:MAG: anti-sigma factor [marine bacterium B5-7]